MEIGAVLITLLLSLHVGLGACVALRGCLQDEDPALRFGLGGIVGLFTTGWLMFFLGHIPGGLGIGPAVPVVVGVVFWIVGIRANPTGWVQDPAFSGLRAWMSGFSKLGYEARVVPVIAVLAFVLVCVSAALPSDMNDWDSLAYHLAVPKQWQLAGQITYVPTIHHSNFPFAADNLYFATMPGQLMAGGKAYMAATFGFGLLLVFGMARSLWGKTAGLWSVLAYCGIPVVLWESGTAYIDVAHGLYALIAIFYLGRVVARDAQKSDWMCLSFGLAGAMSTKFTGYQVAVAVALVGGTAFVVQKRNSYWAPFLLSGVAALAVASPWLIRNTVHTGNPFYPFFYEVFGGRNWDSFMAGIYKNEQKTFGVGHKDGKLDFVQAGHAALGLAYQPGRYVNPGQTVGLGAPTGALGCAVIAAGLLGLVQLRRHKEARTMLAVVGVLLCFWFVLSQQSRYLTIIALPLAVVAGGLSIRGPSKWPMRVLAIVQVAATFYVVWLFSIDAKRGVLSGEMNAQTYQREAVGGIAAIAPGLNQDPAVTKVALYDEVFGYFLDKPYIWANPGHSKVLPHEDVVPPSTYVEALQDLGVSHVFVNLRFEPRDYAMKWFAESGALPPGLEAFTNEERNAMLANREIRWKITLAHALRDGLLTLESEPNPRYVLMRVNPKIPANPPTK